QRVERCAEEQGLQLVHLLDAATLAHQTALPEEMVRNLLEGGGVAPGPVEERVTSRIKVLAATRLRRTGGQLSELAIEVGEYLGCSPKWARLLLDGRKMPSVPLLYQLADYFEVEGDGRFFTAPPATALNRALLRVLKRYQPEDQPDPLDALMEKYGVEASMSVTAG
ncbi:hypothetical protein NGM37_17615, partial [Streptomyces sp. TRM76130]|nr:hypothetical protein [Streptomyces sp. TRM76130]